VLKINYVAIALSVIAIALYIPFYIQINTRLSQIEQALIYKSPIEITSVNATQWKKQFPEVPLYEVSLTFTVRNNGERVEYIKEGLFSKFLNNSRIGLNTGMSGESTILPKESVTKQGTGYTWELKDFIIEIRTNDGDIATAIVEIPE
jgi:hypothetical protein